MRNGTNIEKTSPDLAPFGRHRVVLPVYIPSDEGYFSQSRQVLRLCLESLRRTTSGRVSVSIVSNGSIPSVNDELREHYESGWIDQLLINRRNWGRVDAVAAVIRGTFEPLITVSDADVFFRTGWLDAIEDLFTRFPECGSASPVPLPEALWHYTSATILGGIVRRELSFRKIVPDDDLDRFARSIGRPDMYGPDSRAAQLVVQRGGAYACVGCGHFVCTIRREVVESMPREPSLRALGGRASERWLDIPPDRAGFWRLSTTRAYAWHMGNTPEPWMHDELAALPEPPAAVGELAPISPPRLRWTSRLPWRARRLLTQGVKKTRLRPVFFRTLGHPHHTTSTIPRSA
jgi:hypothetical protein